MQCKASKTRCHVLKHRGRLSGKKCQEKTFQRTRCCAACLRQQKWLKYTPMNMWFLYEDFDNKGPTAMFLMRLDCLCLCVDVGVYIDRQVSTILSYFHLSWWSVKKLGKIMKGGIMLFYMMPEVLQICYNIKKEKLCSFHLLEEAGLQMGKE